MAFLDNMTLPQAVLAALSLYVAWTFVRPFVVRTALDNIPGPPSASFYTGNVTQFMSRHCWEWRDELMNKYGRVAVIRGLFNAHWLVTHDPKAMHTMFIKEQDIFEEPVLGMRILLGPGLLGTLGEQHRRQRKMLNPVFSTKHLRDMTPLFYEIIHKTRDAIMSRVQAGSQNEKGAAVELDMLSWMGRTTLEVLGQAGLGYSFDPLTQDVADDFATAVKELFPQMAKSIVLRLFLPIAVKFGTPSFRRRVLDMIQLPSIQRLKDISDILHARSVVIFNEKKEALARGDDAVKHQIGEGRDIMSILLRENMMASDEDKLQDEELIGQVSTMILAGMDTTANSLARILQLLAERPEAQERLREEIMHAVEVEGHEDTLDFDRLLELPYLDAVCRETLRVYPGVASVFRDTIKDTILPLSEPIRGLDGTLMPAIAVPKGTRVIGDIYGCNRNSALWGPDAHEWRPERWIEGLPKAVEDAHVPGVYSNLMTFIGGGRACIGFKFAQVEIKTVLCVLLQHFKFEPTGKPIAWNFAAVQYPTVGKESTFPELPLKVSLLNP
ncbi:cytochrome P450 [Cubamyces sp. BRFM 1775]|nr:cytochrome P450 [Cubamyces sp. BRFM 1775]